MPLSQTPSCLALCWTLSAWRLVALCRLREGVAIPHLCCIDPCPLPDLNRRLLAYHANTLPTELKGRRSPRSLTRTRYHRDRVFVYSPSRETGPWRESFTEWGRLPQAHCLVWIVLCHRTVVRAVDRKVKERCASPVPSGNPAARAGRSSSHSLACPGWEGTARPCRSPCAIKSTGSHRWGGPLEE